MILGVAWTSGKTQHGTNGHCHLPYLQVPKVEVQEIVKQARASQSPCGKLVFPTTSFWNLKDGRDIQVDSGTFLFFLNTIDD